jgi:hypothetical protein
MQFRIVIYYERPKEGAQVALFAGGAQIGLETATGEKSKVRQAHSE